jgi:hypothetical protein
MPARRSRAEVADREVRAIDMRRNGATYDQIGQQLGISTSGAAQIVKRVLDRHVTEALPDVRKLELDRLDQLQLAALLVLRREHWLVQAGKVVIDQAGLPMRDDGPTLAAIDRLVRIGESRRRLLGVDAPVRHEVKFFTVDELDSQIAELEQQLALHDRNPQPQRD